MILDDNALIALGQIIRPQGLSGEIIVFPHRPATRTLRPDLKVTIIVGQIESHHIVDSVQPKGKFIRLKLKGIDNRTAADVLVGGQIYCTKSSLPPKAENEYYFFEIIGLDLVDRNLSKLGVIKDILTLPANDVLVIDNDRGEFMVPFVKDVIQRVDLQSGQIVIESLERIIADEN